MWGCTRGDSYYFTFWNSFRESHGTLSRIHWPPPTSTSSPRWHTLWTSAFYLDVGCSRWSYNLCMTLYLLASSTEKLWAKICVSLTSSVEVWGTDTSRRHIFNEYMPVSSRGCYLGGLVRYTRLEAECIRTSDNSICTYHRNCPTAFYKVHFGNISSGYWKIITTIWSSLTSSRSV